MHSILPLRSSNWILRGLVVERSNKLSEKVLACINEYELLYGKPARTVVVGLALVAVS